MDALRLLPHELNRMSQRTVFRQVLKGGMLLVRRESRGEEERLARGLQARMYGGGVGVWFGIGERGGNLVLRGVAGSVEIETGPDRVIMWSVASHLIASLPIGAGILVSIG